MIIKVENNAQGSQLPSGNSITYAHDLLLKVVGFASAALGDDGRRLGGRRPSRECYKDAVIIIPQPPPTRWPSAVRAHPLQTNSRIFVTSPLRVARLNFQKFQTCQKFRVWVLPTISLLSLTL